MPQQFPSATFAPVQVSFELGCKPAESSRPEMIAEREWRGLGIVAKHLVAADSTEVDAHPVLCCCLGNRLVDLRLEGQSGRRFAVNARSLAIIQTVSIQFCMGQRMQGKHRF